jgi:hypothetical protein
MTIDGAGFSAASPCLTLVLASSQGSRRYCFALLQNSRLKARLIARMGKLPADSMVQARINFAESRVMGQSAILRAFRQARAEVFFTAEKSQRKNAQSTQSMMHWSKVSMARASAQLARALHWFWLPAKVPGDIALHYYKIPG